MLISKLHTALTLLCSAPILLSAQVTAGDPSHVFITSADHLLDPASISFPGSSLDTLSVDIDGDGVLDIRFLCGHVNQVDALFNFSYIELHHAGVAVSASGNNLHAVRHIEAGTSIDADLPTWRNFDPEPFTNNTIYIGNVGSSLGAPVAYGSDEWYAQGPVDLEGYLAVRLTHEGSVRYGWVHLISHVEAGNVWLRIIDLAIQDPSTSVPTDTGLEAITAHFLSDGHLWLQGPLSDVQHYLVHDASGRTVLQGRAPLRSTIDLSGKPGGMYGLTLVGRSGRRTIKLAQ